MDVKLTMNKKELILSSGFTYKELLMIRRYFQYITRHYFKTNEPRNEDENLSEAILVMARVCFWTPFNCLLSCIFLPIITLTITGQSHYAFAILFTASICFIASIEGNAKIFNVTYLSIVKLMILRIRAKIAGSA